ncbi:hypothetical protein Sango_1131900 [Sesamum angolense]|uniref:Uncharacterized protein n=1 Tax=Sesamum angolense TaxID=2727404 RepID=A0AAE1WVX3_9LAMI|nr:hypothetical protein Sango_1131900 [Sesamum angolense]
MPESIFRVAVSRLLYETYSNARSEESLSHQVIYHRLPLSGADCSGVFSEVGPLVSRDKFLPGRDYPRLPTALRETIPPLWLAAIVSKMPDTIVTSETSSKSSDFNSNSRIICRVCEKQFSQYTCLVAILGIALCIATRYKSHSLRCTESFMRENVMEELQQLQPDEQSKSKMLDILKRFHEEVETDSLDEEESDSSLSEETIQKILWYALNSYSLGDQISFDDLSVEEKKRFQRAVATGELSKLIEPWDPWWFKPSAKNISLSFGGTQLVRPIVKEGLGTSSENGVESDQWHDIPPGPETPLLPVSKLTASAPSPLLAVHLVDIIYSYCFTLRLYNGDPKSDPLESVMKLIQAAEKELKSEKLHKSKRAELKSKLRSAERKVYFMMCWVHEQPSEAWSSLAAIVNTEKSSAVVFADSKKSTVRMQEKTERSGKPLIKEVK